MLAWKCNVEEMCRFTRCEWTRGLRALKADQLRVLQARLSEVAHEVVTCREQFKDLYKFTFR